MFSQERDQDGEQLLELLKERLSKKKNVTLHRLQIDIPATPALTSNPESTLEVEPLSESRLAKSSLINVVDMDNLNEAKENKPILIDIRGCRTDLPRDRNFNFQQYHN